MLWTATVHDTDFMEWKQQGHGSEGAKDEQVRMRRMGDVETGRTEPGLNSPASEAPQHREDGLDEANPNAVGQSNGLPPTNRVFAGHMDSADAV